MTELAQRKCVPCEGGVPPLPAERVQRMLAQVPGWDIENGKLTRDVKVADFRAALALVNAIGAIAEQEGHHPDIAIHGWNRVRIEFFTHAIQGLSENDFIMAARVSEALPQP
jgi:4a-hydroxytetrahydrobiopterin dehydratase